ncbi:class I SAM-dependent methyltransferase [Actinacidiphila sp. DG2A-62]|uniref:class I SAM-dependent methyltransferase n=1 Tax=Actinacidiphila sp. DG2A-62 TaxID=3108821 RepID=UPI002DBEAB87|nr:class I SAM-dependent methyltransferase [Actinacidiphila sp. DG2A-62]MEC3993196.1 class I SAM-dependent methyltransferase [Actinacidiphila sp. DG2A-62]
MGVSTTAAKAWVERWERQQQHYAVDREERFTVIADVVEHVVAGRAAPLLLDLGCGPGSLAARLAARIAGAEIVAVDMDPVLLELGRAHHGHIARYVDAVIGADGWADALDLGRPLDAAVSTTALHYLPEAELLRTYRQLAQLLRPGGVVVNGDHFPPRTAASSRLTAHVGRCRAERSGARAAEDWHTWWHAAAQDPQLADLFAQREQRQRALRGGRTAHWRLTAEDHARLMRRAGFQDVTSVWQVGDSCVLVAVKE